MHEYGVELVDLDDVNDVDCVIVAVAHEQFKTLALGHIDNYFLEILSNTGAVPLMLKACIRLRILKKQDISIRDYNCWRANYLKVMLIDPWGINNTSEYLNGLIYGFSEKVELTVFTNCYFEQYITGDATVKRVFFEKTEKMKPSRKRTILRGLEYIKGYKRVIKEIKGSKYDIVHINWMLSYKLDILFLKRIKKYCNKIVYTAHNVLPHVNGDDYKKDLKKIYQIVDDIILHGEEVKKEFIKEFPEYGKKIYVQKHGCILQDPNSIDYKVLPEKIRAEIVKGKVIILSCGAVFPNKGTDRLVRIWLDKFSEVEAFLIAGGRQNSDYPELNRLKPLIAETPNAYYFDGFIDDDVMNALFSCCSVVFLPYRHASMSGIIFSAAQYAKPIACTDVGAFREYLENGEDSIVFPNTDAAIEEAIGNIINMQISDLRDMGERLKRNIQEKCDWSNICAGIVNSVYLKDSE